MASVVEGYEPPKVIAGEHGELGGAGEGAGKYGEAEIESEVIWKGENR